MTNHSGSNMTSWKNGTTRAILKLWKSSRKILHSCNLSFYDLGHTAIYVAYCLGQKVCESWAEQVYDLCYAYTCTRRQKRKRISVSIFLPMMWTTYMLSLLVGCLWDLMWAHTLKHTFENLNYSMLCSAPSVLSTTSFLSFFTSSLEITYTK